MSLVDNAIEAIKGGQIDNGRQMLEQALEQDESNEQIWLWLSVAVDSDDDREICLENVLALSPENDIAQNALQSLRAGAFDPSIITGVDMVDDFAEDDFSEMTFHDQFFAEDDDFVDDELEMPSVMGGSPAPKIKEQKKETKKKGPALNMRMILIGVVALLICGGLGLAAAYNFFLSGEPSPDGQPSQEAPAEGGEDAPPTETPIPEPTPTPTETPFVLPTAKPTDEPTETATKVVSPTVVVPTETPTPASE